MLKLNIIYFWIVHWVLNISNFLPFIDYRSCHEHSITDTITQSPLQMWKYWALNGRIKCMLNWALNTVLEKSDIEFTCLLILYTIYYILYTQFMYKNMPVLSTQWKLKSLSHEYSMDFQMCLCTQATKRKYTYWVFKVIKHLPNTNNHSEFRDIVCSMKYQKYQ